MKMKLHPSFCVFAAVLALPAILSAQTATFYFLDPSIEDGEMMAIQVGDVIGGAVVINLSTGEYTVTWNANPNFQFPGMQRFDLALGNHNDGSTVALSHTIPGFETNASVVYSGYNAAFTGWVPGDTISTFGESPDFATSFQSGVYSTDPLSLPQLGSDPVSYTGVLEGETVPIDTDGDGVPDVDDPFPESDTSETVVLFGVDTGIANALDGLPVNESGATLADVILALESSADENAVNRGGYMERMTSDLKLLVEEGWLTSKERAKIIKIIAGNN